MESLRKQIENLELQTCFLDITPSKEQKLESYYADLEMIENQLQGLEEFLDSEEKALEKGQLLLERFQKQNEILLQILNAIPEQKPAPTPVQAPKPKAQPSQPKVTTTSIRLITPEDFKKIPAYSLNRMTIQKLNQHINELNTFIKDKYAILNMQPSKMTKWQKDLLYQHRENALADTKSLVFVTEKELREKYSWTNSQFALNSVGRNVLSILRSLGRIKEVRGGGQTRICLL
jgi:hypothetical protein